ncbi:hypothetical protein [Streptomyces sp. NPDC008121]|uniref:hypothetical protein n=1 Tax=Streptomyces sp. NPDC008121 TaxID=3364809 RepID=UPI0036EEC0FF
MATWPELGTSEIVGYAMAGHHRSSLVVDALVMAADRGRLQPGCIAHSDRHPEYTSGELRREIHRLGLRQNIGRTCSCFGNAPPSPSSQCCKKRSAPAAGPTGPPPAPRSSPYRDLLQPQTAAEAPWGYRTPLQIRQRHEQGRPRSVSMRCPTSRGKFRGRITRPLGLCCSRSRAHDDVAIDLFDALLCLGQNPGDLLQNVG